MLLTKISLGPRDPGHYKAADCVWMELDFLRLSLTNSKFFRNLQEYSCKHLEDPAGNDPYHSDCNITGTEGSSLPQNTAFLRNSKSAENDTGPATVKSAIYILSY